MKHPEDIRAVTSEAIRDGKWVTWGAFRGQLESSKHSRNLGRLFDPFTFVMVHRYLRYWVDRVEGALRNDSTTPEREKEDAINMLIGGTFLNHLLDCSWASYIVRDVIVDLFECCLEHRLDLGLAFRRYEYNMKEWERMDDQLPDDKDDKDEAKWHEAIREFTREFRGISADKF